MTKDIILGNLIAKDSNPSGQIVAVASKFVSKINLKSGNISINAKSLMGVIAFTSAVDAGMPVQIITSDDRDAEEALTAMATYLS